MKKIIAFVLFILLSLPTVCMADNLKELDALGLEAEIIKINLSDELAETVEHLVVSGIDENGVIVWLSAGSDLPEKETETIISGSALIGYDGNLYYSGDRKVKPPELFYNDVAAVEINGKYGYIDKDYNLIVKPVYDKVTTFENGYGAAQNGDVIHIFDKSGRLVRKFNGYICNYDYEHFLRNGAELVFADGKYLVLDSELNEYEIEPVNYSEYDNFINANRFLLNGSLVAFVEYSDRVLTESDRFADKSDYYIYGKEDGKYVIKYKYTSENPTAGEYWMPWVNVLSNGLIVTGAYNREQIAVIDPNRGVLVNSEKTDIKDFEVEGFGEYIMYGNGLYNAKVEKLFEFDLSEYPFDVITPYHNAVLEQIAEPDCIKASDDRAVYLLGKDKTANYNNLDFYTLNSMLVIKEKGVELNRKPNIVDPEKVPSFEDEIWVYIDGKHIKFERVPFIENERTLVPMRRIFEELGAEVTWDNDTQTAVAVRGGIEIKITIDSEIMYKNGETIQLDAAARLIDYGYTFVPLRAVSEAFGCDVQWNGELQTVDITTK